MCLCWSSTRQYFPLDGEICEEHLEVALRTANKSDAKADGRYLQKRMGANYKHHTENVSHKYLTQHKYQRYVLVAGDWFTPSSLLNSLNKPRLHEDQRRQVPVTRNSAWPPVFFPYPNTSYKLYFLKMLKCLCCFHGQAWCLSCKYLWIWRDVSLKLSTSSSPRDIKLNIKSEL